MYRGELFLRGFDGDIRQFVAEQMRGQGVDLKFNSDVTRLEAFGSGKQVTYQDGSQQTFDGSSTPPAAYQSWMGCLQKGRCRR